MVFFSKTFGYAVRGILYIASTSDGGKKIRVEEISRQNDIPKYFLAKVMNKVAKADILIAIKGPNGGFCPNNNTLKTPLLQLYRLLDGSATVDGCVLHLKNCNEQNLCPMDSKMGTIKKTILSMLADTTIDDLLRDEKELPVRAFF
jgi:Rrf2 family transcriptional regulator, iron-sulfur cluster assembly transcription factor